jgi:hypothetical protein
MEASRQASTGPSSSERARPVNRGNPAVPSAVNVVARTDV